MLHLRTRWRRLSGETKALLLLSLAMAVAMTLLTVAVARGDILKKDTAGQKVVLGRFVTTATGYTSSTALTVTVTISKAGATLAARSSTVTPVSVGGGYYAVTLDATDTATAGSLFVKGTVAGYLDCFARNTVIGAKPHDSIVAGTDNLETDVIQWLGTAAPAPTVAGVPVVQLGNQAHGGAAASLTLADYSAFKATGFSVHSAADVYTAFGTGVNLTAVALADATSDAVIADAVWNAATATYGSAGSYGLLAETNLDATISSRLAPAGTLANVTLCATVTTLTGFNTTGTGLTAIPWNAAWDAEVQSECSDAITAAGLSTLNAAAVTAAVWNIALPGAYVAGRAGYIVGTNLDGTVTSRPTAAQVQAAVTAALTAFPVARPADVQIIVP